MILEIKTSHDIVREDIQNEEILTVDAYIKVGKKKWVSVESILKIYKESSSECANTLIRFIRKELEKANTKGDE